MSEFDHHKISSGSSSQVFDSDDGSENGGSDEETVLLGAQAGVQNIEATAAVWSRKTLIVAYLMIWLIYLVDTWQQGTTSSLTPYVTSAFKRHSLTAATGIMSNIIAGVFKLTLAKILDVWGRPQGYALSVFTLTLGLIMMAACRNVETYAAAQVFYWVGYQGLMYSLGIFVADTSALRNRGLMLAFATSPNIITMWLGGPTASVILNGPGFRWGFALFSIITPIITMPLFGLLVWNLRKARSRGLVPERQSSVRTTKECIKHYFVQFDGVGLILASVGLALFLLPFSIYSYQSAGWKSPLVLSMLLVGILLLGLFVAWEKWFSPVQFLPYQLLTDRTVLGACILPASLFMSFYLWDSYFFSFLQVVNGLSVTPATYINSIFSVGGCLWCIVVGLFIRVTGRYKAPALYFGMPLTFLGVLGMLLFRRPDVWLGWLIMCQILIAVAGGSFVICEQIAAMAAVSHQHVAVVLAIEAMFSSIGAAMGQSLASAIWTGEFPKKLAEYLPPESRGDLKAIYGDLRVQLSYPMGSPTRMAIARAYADAQKVMLIASTAVLVIGLVSIMAWRDVNVKHIKQVKGIVI